MAEPKLTAWEKARIVAIELHGMKRSLADIQHQPDIDRRIKRIKDQARKRANGK
ncbi:DUF6257 family protein [Streptomyces sp. NPDC006333]|uniref:DUF6257 family protein n=1 Tax=Streptomyces sp. NPDC006333 TaxID=3156753 RepID=UPI0033A567D4